MMEELKPCPFCGGKAEYWIDNDYQDRHVITCGYCGCEKRYEYSMDGVIEEWNTRHVPDGYALVPVEPTQDMIDEALYDTGYEGVSDDAVVYNWKAMIAAAQEQK
jgi:Lar family restriction alleviation protein